MTDTPKIVRPQRDLVDAVRAIGAATASATLAHMGIRCAAITGPAPWTKGSVAAGPALTLQFMPKREDLYGEGEYKDVEKQLHRHVLYHVERGETAGLVDARADMRSGVFGEMMMTYFKGQGGAGMVIDGWSAPPDIAKFWRAAAAEPA